MVWQFSIWSLENIEQGCVKIIFSGEYEAGFTMKIVVISRYASAVKITIADLFKEINNDYTFDLEKDMEVANTLIEVQFGFVKTFSPEHINIEYTLN